VGSPTSREVDVRIVAATNQDLEKLRKGKRFLDDLYWRLSTLQITLSSLVDHIEDVFPLAKYFATSLSLKQGVGPFSDFDICYWLCSRYIPRILGHEGEPPVIILPITPVHVMFGLHQKVSPLPFMDLIRSFSGNPWPGNARQLQHDVERAVVDEELTQLGDRPILAGVLREGELIITSLPYSHQELETSDLRIAADICPTQGRAARLLGISSSWLSRKSKRLLGQRRRQRPRRT
jgi:DNA-binding NtrC family response regulator